MLVVWKQMSTIARYIPVTCNVQTIV